LVVETECFGTGSYQCTVSDCYKNKLKINIYLF
jgi:hypothetical protein